MLDKLEICKILIHINIYGLLGWWKLTLMLGRVWSLMFGPYIYLALDVLKILLVFFLVYSPVLIAFALTFHMLLPNNKNFGDPVSSLGKVLAMMLGELEFEDNFTSEASSGLGSTQIAYFLFLLVGNIIIANLLIGLTVSRTEELFQRAELIRQENIVKQICLRKMFKETSLWMFHTSLFSFLNSFCSDQENQLPKSSEASIIWKVCVMPNSKKEKGRQVLKDHGNIERNRNSVSIFGEHYSVYLYDDIEAHYSRFGNITI